MAILTNIKAITAQEMKEAYEILSNHEEGKRLYNLLSFLEEGKNYNNEEIFVFADISENHENFGNIIISEDTILEVASENNQDISSINIEDIKKTFKNENAENEILSYAENVLYQCILKTMIKKKEEDMNNND